MRRLGAAFAAALVAFIPASASAAPPSRAAAERALAKVQQLQRGQGVKTGRELTPALAQLFASLPRLSGEDRRLAEALLARPDDTQPDPGGTHKWDPGATQGTPYATAHFVV